MGKARNISLVGHSGSGKTTLATALLKIGGIKEQIAFDASPEEKARGYSIDLGFGSCLVKGTRITLLDTPGGSEFVEEIYKAVPVCDLALLVVNGEKGVEVVTERAWELLGALKRPTLVFVNELDRENADFDTALSALAERLPSRGKFVPLQIPIKQGGSLVGVVDVLGSRAVYFADKGKKDIPPELESTLAERKNFLLEEVSSLDDELLMKFLEGGEIADSEVSTALAKGVAQGALIPVLCGSALEDKGVDLLMGALMSLAPAPAPGGDGAWSGIVFNLANDPYLGRLAYVRLLAGTLKEGTTSYDLSSGGKVEIRDLYSFEGTKQKRVPQAEGGEIVAIGKAEHLALGVTLAAQPGAEPFRLPEFPKPIFSRTIVPKTQADVEKMSAALKEIVSTKATLAVEREPVTKEMLLWGMGDVHLAVVIDRLKNRYNVSLETRQPRIPYKETIQKTATAQYRHKKQTGGRGQFGEVFLRVEPRHSGEGFKFADEIKGASIPGQYIPGVEKGVVEALEEGILAKYPVTDILVAVYDGSFHPVDSSELAFKLAGRNAFRLAVEAASPCLLEPIMSLEVRTSEDHTGAIIGDLNGRRGRIHGMEPSTQGTKILAEVPLAEVQSYALDLKSLTQGRATFQMEFLKYQKVPANLQEKIVALATEETK
jgi:elongation factor G